MFKKLLTIGSILLLLSGCVINKQCRKISLSERAMSAELVDSFIKHQIATIYSSELSEEDAATLILSHEEYVKVFVARYGIETYKEVGEMYYDEFITVITLNFIKAVKAQDIQTLFQMQYAYQNLVVDPLYIQYTTKDLNEGFENFNEGEFYTTMEQIKVPFMAKWMNLIKGGK